MNQSTRPMPSLTDALIPLAFLIVLLVLSVTIYGDSSSYGANQIALLLAAGVAAIIGLKNGYRWKEIEQGVVDGISLSMNAILILLAVGSLIGTWILSGTVPAMIYYGLQILNPTVFYAATCLICALAALCIGSSWTVAGTIGIGLMGVASGLGLSEAITAGAVISGAYFGDKMSPLSDTTNLAPAVAGTDLFTHIRHMTWTTVPSIIIALIAFSCIGIFSDVSGEVAGLEDSLTVLGASFEISLWSFIPLLVVFVLAFKQVPALPTIMIGALLGGVFAVFLQPELVLATAQAENTSAGLKLLEGVWTAMATGFVASTGNESVDDLLSRGGMFSMMNTVWLILCAMVFGASMEKTRLLEKLVSSVLKLANSTGSLITTTVFTCIGTNIIAADQYIAIVLPGRMYRAEFKRRGLQEKNLSRVLEDSGTITSPLIPWNTCGAYMAGTLGVATGAYLPFCFFNLVNPVISIIYGITHFKIEKIEHFNEADKPADAVA